MAKKKRHPWKFFRAGGVDQVVLETADDLTNLRHLDQKLWAALACPAKGLEFDERTLSMLDGDKDGRIRAPDILAAIEWLDTAMEDLQELFEGSKELPLASIARETPVGEDLRAGAKLVLESLGKADAEVLTLEDVSSTEGVFAATKLNGDGIIPADAAEGEELKKTIEDIISVTGSLPDRSGKPGIDQPKLDAFFEQATGIADWLDSRQAPGVLAVGESTPAAAEALEAVRAKVDDFFARCRLVAFDPRAAAAVGPTEGDLASLGSTLLASGSEEIARLPLAKIQSGGSLPLESGVNLAWAARVRAFARDTVAPILGALRTALTEDEWTAIKDRLAGYAEWHSKRPANALAPLDDARVRDLARGGARAALTDLVAQDASYAKQASQIENLEKLIRLRRDLVPLLENFVSFATFYGRKKAIFQAGTLYLDARSCDLCLSVEDVPKHGLLAAKSQAYLVYCDCVRKSDDAKRSIVAAVTGGDVDNIVVGRNGLFYDRKGADWDATITKIIENPISIRQAFWLPYKRFIRIIEETFAKRAKAADEESGKKMDGLAVQAGSVGEAEAKAADAKDKEKEKSPIGPKPVDVGTVAAIGVAVGGIATFFSSVLATFFGLGFWMPVGVIALLLAISGPSMLIAWLKLRQRNIGPILDANGWAVNTMARVNVPFGGSLTALAALPQGASRSLADPYAEKRRPWKTYLFLLVVVALGLVWYLGRLDGYLPEKTKASSVFHREP
jgi:hypothetical protein